MKTIRITYIALLSAIAIIFGYIESLFPLPAAIPGIKLGLSNIVILFALQKLEKKDAFLIMLIKVLVCSLLFSGMTALLYSLSGGILSFLAMIFFERLNLSLMGISMSGGVFHNVGQLLAAFCVLKSRTVFFYFPVLLISGLVVGLLTGILCGTVLGKLRL